MLVADYAGWGWIFGGGGLVRWVGRNRWHPPREELSSLFTHSALELPYQEASAISFGKYEEQLQQKQFLVNLQLETRS